MSGRFVALGLGRWVRADQVVGLEPIEGDSRGPGRRTLVHVAGRSEPMIASRSEAAILADLDALADAGASPAEPSLRRRGERRSTETPPSLF